MELRELHKVELIKRINESNLSDNDKSEAIAMIIASGNNKPDLAKEFLKTIRVADSIHDLYKIIKETFLNEGG